MDLGKYIAKVKEILKAIPGIFSGLLPKGFPGTKDTGSDASDVINVPFYRKIGALFTWKTIPNFMTYLETRFLYHFPEKKRRPILFGIWGMAMLFLVLVISIPVTLSGRSGQAAPSGIFRGITIPVEELFIPTEPDFIPEFILEREPRSSWLLDDIRPHWRNPEQTELWKEQVKAAVDRIMESVP